MSPRVRHGYMLALCFTILAATGYEESSEFDKFLVVVFLLGLLELIRWRDEKDVKR